MEYFKCLMAWKLYLAAFEIDQSCNMGAILLSVHIIELLDCRSPRFFHIYGSKGSLDKSIQDSHILFRINLISWNFILKVQNQLILDARIRLLIYFQVLSLYRRYHVYEDVQLLEELHKIKVWPILM